VGRDSIYTYSFNIQIPFTHSITHSIYLLSIYLHIPFTHSIYTFHLPYTFLLFTHSIYSYTQKRGTIVYGRMNQRSAFE